MKNKKKLLEGYCDKCQCNYPMIYENEECPNC